MAVHFHAARRKYAAPWCCLKKIGWTHLRTARKTSDVPTKLHTRTAPASGGGSTFGGGVEGAAENAGAEVGPEEYGPVESKLEQSMGGV
jgi:hypothetical protein